MAATNKVRAVLPVAVLVCAALCVAMVQATTGGASCSSDMDCNANGDCFSGVCKCDAPWTGTACELLGFAPLPFPSAAYGYSPNVSSWGGNPVQDVDGDGKFHLFVAEMGGKDCGLHVWGSQSQIVHAVADSVTGPYTRHDVALPHQAHNPQVLVHNGSWYIAHIGAAENSKPLHNCTQAGSVGFGSHLFPGTPEKPTKRTLHKAPGPNGPWSPVSGLPDCNNPSPFISKNGTVYLACKWSLHSAPSIEGPWTVLVPKFHPAPSPPDDRIWEDPFLWIDAKGRWHLLSHTWVKPNWPAYSISGHGFSADGLNWHWGSVEPYNGTVMYTDHESNNFATLERPKLVFDANMTPKYLFNGASPVWPCNSCGHCSYCKQKPGVDWTYTLVRALA